MGRGGGRGDVRVRLGVGGGVSPACGFADEVLQLVELGHDLPLVHDLFKLILHSRQPHSHRRLILLFSTSSLPSLPPFAHGNKNPPYTSPPTSQP